VAGASKITITDAYRRLFHQQRNLMELLETISKNSSPESEVAMHVMTVEDGFNGANPSLFHGGSSLIIQIIRQGVGDGGGGRCSLSAS
jgi:hypothetical protein